MTTKKRRSGARRVRAPNVSANGEMRPRYRRLLAHISFALEPIQGEIRRLKAIINSPSVDRTSEAAGKQLDDLLKSTMGAMATPKTVAGTVSLARDLEMLWGHLSDDDFDPTKDAIVWRMESLWLAVLTMPATSLQDVRARLDCVAMAYADGGLGRAYLEWTLRATRADLRRLGGRA